MEAPVTELVALTHVVTALVAVAIGIRIFAIPKGTSRHRRWGAIYVGLVVLLDTAALSLHRESTFGPFHVLAIVSLATILGAVAPMLVMRRTPAILATHAFMMSWSYAGLLAAGIGQIVAQLHIIGPVGVWSAILATLLASGIVIHRRVPKALRKAHNRT